MNSVSTFSGGRWWQAILALAAVALVAGQTLAQEAKDATPCPWRAEKFYVDASPDRREAWEEAKRRLWRFRDDAEEALEEQTRTIDGVYAEATPKLRAYADDLLGVEGKLHHIAGAAEKVVTDIADSVSLLFGGEHLTHRDWADRFNDYAEKSFVRMVFEPETLEQAARGAAQRYLTRLVELENAAIVDLELDLADGALGPLPRVPDLEAEIPRATKPYHFIYGLCDASTVDIGASAVRWYVSEKVADKLTEKQPKGFRKFVANAAVGNQVEGAIEGGMKMVGYDPQGAIAARVAANFDFSRQSLIGPPLLSYKGPDVQAFGHMTIHALVNPYDDVRAVAAQAADLLEHDRHAYLGMRPKLEARFLRRYFALTAAAFHRVFGEETHAPFSIFATGEPQREEMRKWAEEIIVHQVKRRKLYGDNQ